MFYLLFDVIVSSSVNSVRIICFMIHTPRRVNDRRKIPAIIPMTFWFSIANWSIFDIMLSVSSR